MRAAAETSQRPEGVRYPTGNERSAIKARLRHPYALTSGAVAVRTIDGWLATQGSVDTPKENANGSINRREVNPRPSMTFVNPERGLLSLASYLDRKQLVDADEIMSLYRHFDPHTKDTRELISKPWKTDAGIYETLASAYPNLSNTEGETRAQMVTRGENFYQRHMQSAIGAIQGLVEQYAPEVKDKVDLPNDLVIVPSPSELIELLATTGTGEDAKRVRHNASVVLTLALLSAELEAKTQPTRQKLQEVQHLFRTRLFSGDTKDMTVHTLNDTLTNEVLWSSFTPIGEPPTDIPSEDGAILRSKTQRRMRHVEGVGDVIEEVRGKVNPVVKAFRKGMDGREFDPIKDVRDIAGVKFVTQDEKARSELREKVETLLTESYPGTRFEKKEDMGKKAEHQSGKFKGEGYRILFPESNGSQQQVEIEIQYQTAEEHAHNSDHIGTWDQQRKRYDGAAHEITAVERAFNVLRAFFPEVDSETGEGIYKLVSGGKDISWEDIKAKRMHEVAASKLNGRFHKDADSRTPGPGQIELFTYNELFSVEQDQPVDNQQILLFEHNT